MTQPSLAGRRFGAYEVLEELGSGGMGKVYRARNVTLERIVALKTLAPEFSADQEFVQRFLKEARVAARLNHPNVVQIYDFGSVDGIQYLAMEYVDGESLGTRLSRGRLSENEALQIVRQAARALAVAHAAGIVHRDIKPDNLMLTSRGEVKLVDLGIAKRMDEDQGLTQTGQAVGTPNYISPEQIRGLKDIDARADVYSLGATFYHLVTGHAPYKGTSGALVMSMHLTQPLPDPRRYEPGLSEGLCRVLRKTMAKNREERYPDMETLDRDLHRVQAGEIPRAEEPSVTQIEALVDLEAGETLTTGHRPASAAPSASAAATGSSFREEDLHFVEVELARHIGPLARVLVKKAARGAASLVGLAAAVADQIPDEKARRDFRASVRARAK